MEKSTTSPGELQRLIENVQHVAKSYDVDADPTIATDQRAEIREAALRIVNAMSEPGDMTWRKMTNLTESVCLRLAMQLGVFDALPLEGSISRADLAKKVKATESLIERTLRILVGTGMIDQTNDDEYKHNRFSRTYTNVKSGASGCFYQSTYDVVFRPLFNLDKFLLETTEDGIRVEPTSVSNNPLVWHYGKIGQNFWEVMAQYPDMFELFQISMKPMDQLIPPCGPFFDYTQFKASGPDDDRIQVVDVGGGYGKVLSTIVLATPELDPGKCVLQDRAEVIAISGEAQKLGIQTQVIDFFSEQPTKGAKAYFMRMIAHDYQDAEMHRILGNVVDAMADDSKVLICETVVPKRLTEASLPASALDHFMFVIGGKERTPEQFEAMLEPVGLKLVKIHYAKGSTAAIIESVKAKKRNGLAP